MLWSSFNCASGTSPSRSQTPSAGCHRPGSFVLSDSAADVSRLQPVFKVVDWRRPARADRRTCATLVAPAQPVVELPAIARSSGVSSEYCSTRRTTIATLAPHRTRDKRNREPHQRDQPRCGTCPAHQHALQRRANPVVEVSAARARCRNSAAILHVFIRRAADAPAVPDSRDLVAQGVSRRIRHTAHAEFTG